MGHSIKLDKIYYDIDNPESVRKMVSEYVKATDGLTMNEAFRLKKEVSQLQEKIKDVPKLELLQQSLVQKDLEMSAMRKHIEEKDTEKDKTIEIMKLQLEDLMTQRKASAITTNQQLSEIVKKEVDRLLGYKADVENKTT